MAIINDKKIYGKKHRERKPITLPKMQIGEIIMKTV